MGKKNWFMEKVFDYILNLLAFANYDLLGLAVKIVEMWLVYTLPAQ